MKPLTVLAFTILALVALHATEPGMASLNAPQDTGYVQLFNGKDLTGWKTHPDAKGTWQVKDGAIVGSGAQISHLYSERGDYENFYYRIEAKINDKGNSGQYFRAVMAAGYPPGYEAQINSTHTDVVRTGSLYPNDRLKFTKEQKAQLVDKMIVKQQLHKPDEWFTQEVIADGNHIQIFVNGKKTVDFIDPSNSFTKGHFAIQQHQPVVEGGKTYESMVTVRKIEVKELPPTKK